MLFYQDLEEIVFHRHEMFDGIDELIVLSGYVGPQPVARLEELPFQTHVIYGMYGSEHIGMPLHRALVELNERIPNLEISYSRLTVHSKCYIWRGHGRIITALVGSANFSRNGLDTPYREMLAETTHDSFLSLSQYLQHIQNSSILCTSNEVEFRHIEHNRRIESNAIRNPNVCTVSFLVNGDVPRGSGINWGFAHAHNNPGDAYVPIHVDDIRNYPALFPPKRMMYTSMLRPGARRTRQNDEVEYIFDDGVVMSGVLEANGPFVEGRLYPKGMCSSPSKNTLGMYLRHRMGINEPRFVTLEDFQRYGRSDIDVSLVSEGVYALDFHSPIR